MHKPLPIAAISGLVMLTPAGLVLAGAWEASWIAFLAATMTVIAVGTGHVMVLAIRARGPRKALLRTWQVATAYSIPTALGVGLDMAVPAWQLSRDTANSFPFLDGADPVFTGLLSPPALALGWFVHTLASAAILWLAITVLSGTVAHVVFRHSRPSTTSPGL